MALEWARQASFGFELTSYCYVVELGFVAISRSTRTDRQLDIITGRFVILCNGCCAIVVSAALLAIAKPYFIMPCHASRCLSKLQPSWLRASSDLTYH